MARNLRALCIAIAAVLALSGLVASGASATAAKFKVATGGTARVTMKAHPNLPAQVFETEIGAAECQEVSGEYNGSEETETLEMTGVEYSGECNVGGLEAEVTFNGCRYIYHAGTKNAAGSQGTMDIKCPAGKKIEIHAAGNLCTLTIPEQEGLGPVTYTNVKTGGKKEEITVHFEVINLTYNWHGALCGEGHDTNGTITSTETWLGETTPPGAEPRDFTIV